MPIKLLLTLILAADYAAAQGGPPRITMSQDAPPSGTCVDSVQVGNIIIRSNNTAVLPVGVYRCTQILDPSIYGAGAFSWQPIGHFAGTFLPTKCDPGEIAVRTDTSTAYLCNQSRSWAPINGGGGGGVPGGNPGELQINSAGAFGGLALPVGLIKGSAGPALMAATGGVDYEIPLTFGAGLNRTGNAIVIPNAAVTDAMLAGGVSTSKLATKSGTGPAVATTSGTLTNGHCLSIDATGTLVDAGFGCASGSGVLTLNGLPATSAPSQTFAKADDANVTLGIASAGTIHTFTLGWTGRLAKARQYSATAYTDGSNSFIATQDFGSANFLRLPALAGYTPTLSGHVGYDLTAGAYVGFTTAKKTFAFLDSSITGTSGGLTGGAAGQFPYQSAPGTTGFRTPNAANGPVVLDGLGSAVVPGAVTASSFQSDGTANGTDYLTGVTSGGVAWGVANIAGTAVTLIYPTNSSAAATGSVFTLGGTMTCPTGLPSFAPTTCRSTAWGANGGSGTGNPYIASFSCSTTPTTIGQATHSQGLYPYVRFTDASNFQVNPGSMTLASSGDLTVTCGVTATLKIYVSGAVGAHPTIPQTFSGASTVTVYGINHNFGSPYVKAQVWDNATPRNWIVPGAVATDATTFNTTISFSSALSGLAILAAN